MSPVLDPTECRILGVLVEKALTTPEYYPLTVNALVNGCNQKSNRHPITTLVDWEVEGALQSLRDKGWAEPAGTGGRAVKWRHKVDVRLGLSVPELAVLAELLLRGPQQPGELRGRASRMGEVPTQEALQDVLERLGRRDPPLVRKHVRVPGERADRWGQTLGREAAAAEPQEGSEPAAGGAAGPPAPVTPAPSLGRDALEERVAALEREVAELRERLEKLTGP